MCLPLCVAGEVGAGANMKLVVNMVMGSMMVSYAEGALLRVVAGAGQSSSLHAWQ